MAAGVRVSALGPEDLVVLRRDGAVVFGVDEFDVLSIDVVFEAELGNDVLVVDDGGAISVQSRLEARRILQKWQSDAPLARNKPDRLEVFVVHF